MHKWYVPRHLPVTFDPTWYRTQSNYAVDSYRYYVSAELEGLLWYDQLGHPTERGWLLYEWQQEQEHPRGSSIWKGNQYNGLFRSLVVASEGGGGLEMRLMLGDQLETVFTPLTFVKPRFNGLRLDAANDYVKGSLILARPSKPDEDNVMGTLSPSDRTDYVNLFGGHAEPQSHRHGGPRTRDAGYQCEHLREAEQQSRTPPQFLPFLPPECPACAPQDRPRHQKGGGRHERALEEPLDRVSQEPADDPCGERRQSEQPDIPPSGHVSPKCAVQQFDEPASIHEEHGNQRGQVHGNLELHALYLQP